MTGTVTTCTTRTTVNGEAFVFVHAPRASALELIRDEAGLTGAKLVCGAGVCGACTVRLDGDTVTACTVPASALAGRHVETIEHHAATDPRALHPVQRAFLAHDALQCGYCTPGFVIEAIAFHERWCEEHGPGHSPSREAIAEAMAGHLCRCGAYPGIYQAVRAACAGEFDETDEVDEADEAGAFASPRLDGIEKVTGLARYTTDVRHDKQLIARLYGADHAHAKVISIDTRAAERLPGVKAIVELLDDPHRVVRYVGHPILAIAALSDAVAAQALGLIRIEYDVRPFVIDADEAAARGAALVFPEFRKRTPNASEGPIPPARWQGNVRTPLMNLAMSRRKGRAKRALAEARAAGRDGAPGSRFVSATFTTPAQTHTALEPHACVANWDAPDRLTVHTSTQAVYVLANEIAERYRLERDNVRVVSEYIGGAFGAKAGLQLEHTAAIELARQAGAPVRLVFERGEEMNIGGCRPATRIDFELASDATRAQLGMACSARGSSGIAVQSQVAMWVKYTYAGPKLCRDVDVTTNAAPAKPMRAPSGPPAFWAMESSIDQLAHRMGADPIALRRQWEDSDVRDALYDWAASIPEWRERRPAGSATGRVRSGIGFAIGNWFNAFHNATRVRIELSAEGLVVECAVQDMGQGARSVIGQTVADELGIPMRSLRVDIGRSDYVRGPTSSASRSTASLHPAALEAAQRLKRRLLERAGKLIALANPRWEKGGIGHRDGHLPLAELMIRLPPISVISDKRGANGRGDLIGRMPTGEVGLNLLLRMTGAVALVAVDVDTRLGRVRARKVWMGLSVGRIVNPALADSQVHGGVVQSLGFALTEQRRHDPLSATLMSAGLDDYHLPGMGETPQIEIHYDQSGFERMRGGACGLAEITALPLAPALGNAVFNATGWRPTDLPLTPDRVIDHVR